MKKIKTVKAGDPNPRLPKQKVPGPRTDKLRKSVEKLNSGKNTS